MPLCSGVLREPKTNFGSHRPPLQLFANNCDGSHSPVRGSPMFEQENALPRSKLHFSFDNRHGLAGAGQDHADVRWHVIAALGTMREIICVFRHEPFEELFQVAARSWIGVLHDDDAATGVLDKNSHCPISGAAPIDLRLNFIRDFVQSLSMGADFELVVVNAHRLTSTCHFCHSDRSGGISYFISPPFDQSEMSRLRST